MAAFPPMAPEWTVEEHERSLAFCRAYDHVKDVVPITEAVEVLTGQRPETSRRAIRCPFEDHDDRTPSFVVYPENDSFYCFGCLRGGDVIDLWRLRRNMSSSWEAVVGLSLEFGFELPAVSQERLSQKSRRERIRQAHIHAVADRWARRAFRKVEMPWIRLIEDSEERRQTVDATWKIWMKHVPFYAWAASLVSRCEERRVRDGEAV